MRTYNSVDSNITYIFISSNLWFSFILVLNMYWLIYFHAYFTRKLCKNEENSLIKGYIHMNQRKNDNWPIWSKITISDFGKFSGEPPLLAGHHPGNHHFWWCHDFSGHERRSLGENTTKSTSTKKKKNLTITKKKKRKLHTKKNVMIKGVECGTATIYGLFKFFKLLLWFCY